MSNATIPIISLAGAIIGVVVGAFLTQRLQRKNTQFARLHEDRISAYSEFILAIVEYRRTHMDRALEVGGLDKSDRTARAFASRGIAWAAYYKVRLLAGDEKIIIAAERAHDAVEKLKDRRLTDGEVRQFGEELMAVLKVFTDLARHEVLSGQLTLTGEIG